MVAIPINPLLRLGGMASGMDTEAIVKSLLSLDRLKVDRVWQQKTRLEWHKEARLEISQKITAFRSATMSVLAKDTNLSSAKAFNTFKVTLPAAAPGIQVTASEQAAAGVHEIASITQLAKAASASSDAAIAAGPVNRATRLGDLALSVPLAFGGGSGDALAFRINDAEFAFTRDTTLQEMFSQINASPANVIAAYSELTGKITLMSRTSGAASKITLENIAGNAFGAGSAFGISGSSWENGQDAILKIDQVDVTRSSNFFTIDGLSYQLGDVSAMPVRFSVDRDFEPAMNRIRNFVTHYNSLLDYAQGKLNEETFPDFAPLTAEQREAMGESEIKLWDAKARSGLFRQDRQLSGLVDDMRRMFYDTVAGTGKSVAGIGLKTGLYFERGRISLDETALQDALAANPDEVMRLFIQTSPSADPDERYRASGLLPRMADAFARYAATYSADSVAQELGGFDKRISALNAGLTRKEEGYWRRFSAMEQALQSMQTQSGWLAQQFG